jgi:hypothetical protein
LDLFKKEIVTNEPALRVGSRIPENSVNLAYIQNPEFNIQDVVEVFDYSTRLPETVVPYNQYQANLVVKDSSKILVSSGGAKTVVPVGNVLLTDEFKYSNSDDYNGTPLYYTYVSRFYHYENNPPLDSSGCYIGQNISILADGVKAQGQYIIRLESPTTTPTNVWKVKVYSEFCSSQDLYYYLQYTKCDKEGKGIIHKFREVYNSDPVLVKTDKSIVLGATNEDAKIFAVDRNLSSDGYNIYVPKQIVDGDSERTPILFRWRLKMAQGADDLYTPWKVDTLFNIAAIYKEEFVDPDDISSLQIGQYVNNGGLLASKFLSVDITSAYGYLEDSSGIVTESQVWNTYTKDWGPTNVGGVSFTRSPLGSEASNVGRKLFASTILETGEVVDRTGELGFVQKLSPTFFTIKGSTVGATADPGYICNWSKASGGATIVSDFNPTGYNDGYTVPQNAIDGTNPPDGFRNTQDVGNIFNSRGAIRPYCKSF